MVLRVGTVLRGRQVPGVGPAALATRLRRGLARRPDAVACRAGAVEVTFREVDASAAALCAYLLRYRDVMPQRPVALLLSRGPQLAVAMAGCVLAGRPFLPVAAGDPLPRSAAMVRLTRPVCVLVDDDGGVPAAFDGVPVLDVRRLPAAYPGGGAADPGGPATGAGGPAYVLFTSGSTGGPKGVQVGPAALANRIAWAQRVFALGDDDVVLQKTPYTFDVALWEILWPLAHGVTTAYLEPDAHRDPGAIVDAIRTAGVTLCHFVPSMLDEFLRWPGADGCGSLRDVLCSGEPLRPELVRRFGRVLPGTRLHNLYGPTEAAIDVTHWAVPHPVNGCHTVPIGQPVDNTELRVVAPDLSAAGPGEPGELLISGIQLADGYVGRPDLTAAAFVRLADGTTAYRTGDRVRLADGDLHYLGRLDDQVKIRGVRVEPGEVEKVLGTALVDSDVAVVSWLGPAGLALAAFVVPPGAAGPPGPATAALRGRVRQIVRAALPEPYVPTAVFAVPRLPTTANGKRDTARLRELAAALAGAPPADPGPPASTGDGPDGSGDDALATLWRVAVAQAGPVDPGAGFLDAGGDSLRAARLAGAVLRSTGRRLPIRWLVVENVSLDELRRRLAATVDRVAARADGPAPPTAAQRALWLHGRVRGGLAPYNVVSGRIFPAGVPIEQVVAAVRRTVRRHDALRCVLRPDPGGATADGSAEVALYPCAAPDPVPVTARDAVAGRDFAVQAGEAAQVLQEREFPLERGPLFEVVVLRDPRSASCAVLFGASHLFCDQHSVELWWAELLSGRDEPVVGGDGYLAWVRDRSARERDRRVAVAAFWRRELAGIAPHLPLPFTRERSGPPAHTGDPALRSLDADTARSFRVTCRRLRVRSGPALLAAFAGVLGSWAGAAEVVVGVPFDGRRTAAETGMMGFLVDTLPVRVPVQPDRPLAEVARDVQDRVDRAADHPIGLDDLLRALGGPRRMERHAAFRVWFNDLSTAEQVFAPPAAPSLPVRCPRPPALFDVGLYAHPGPAGALDLQLVCARDVLDGRAAGALADAVVAVVRTFAGDASAATLAAALPGDAGPAVPSPGPPVRVADLVARFAETADRHPERAAIRYAGAAVTYAALRDQVERLAAGLAAAADEHGSGPVAVLGARVPGLAAMVLAGWRCGVPLVVLDAGLPAGYAAGALRASGAVLAVTLAGEPVVPAAAAAAGVRTVAVDDLAAEGGIRSRSPGRIAHLLVTSGTSGVPKLVGVAGEAFAAALLGQAGEFGLSAADRFALLSGVGHDPMFRDLLGPLVLGASVGIPDAATFRTPERLLRWLRAERVTVLNLTPARAALLSAAATVSGEALPGVRLVVSAGAPLTAAVAGQLADLCPNAALYNGYGTTEVPQLASAHRIGGRGRGHPPGEPLPIGGGIGARRLVVLRDGRPAGPGQLGEIAIATTEPLSDLPDGAPRAVDFGAVRAVPTGDLGRVDLDGAVRWCGRADRQVSVDGYRVEPSAVEHALLGVPGVAAALVAPRSPHGRLVAYVVPAEGNGAVPPGRLLACLGSTLPAWAVPDTVHVVPRLAVDANGKADPAATAALVRHPAPAGAEHGDAGPDAALHEVLRRHAGDEARLTPTANFFEAGLDSLRLLGALGDLHRAGYPEIDLVDLFRWPNVRALGAALRARTGRPEPGRRPVDPAEPGRPGMSTGPHHRSGAADPPRPAVAERRRQVRRRFHADPGTRGRTQ